MCMLDCQGAKRIQKLAGEKKLGWWNWRVWFYSILHIHTLLASEFFVFLKNYNQLAR